MERVLLDADRVPFTKSPSLYDRHVAERRAAAAFVDAMTQPLDIAVLAVHLRVERSTRSADAFVRAAVLGHRLGAEALPNTEPARSALGRGS